MSGSQRRLVNYAEHGEIIGRSRRQTALPTRRLSGSSSCPCSAPATTGSQRGNRADFGLVQHMGCGTELAHRMSSRGDYAPAFPLIPAEWKDENMPINFDHHKVELNWGGQPLTLETGKIARQADGAVLATLGETVLLATVVSAQDRQARPGLLPADRQLPGKVLRRRQDPGRLLQARRPSDRKRDADLAPHRPPDPPAVPRWLPATRRRSSSPFSSTTWRTIPTCSPWSPPPRP